MYVGEFPKVWTGAAHVTWEFDHTGQIKPRYDKTNTVDCMMCHGFENTTISPDGVVRYPKSSNLRGIMDLNKNSFMVNNALGERSDTGIFLRTKADAFSQSDLEGKWTINSTATSAGPSRAGWERKLVQISKDGVMKCLEYQNSAGAESCPEPEAGTISIAPDGQLQYGGELPSVGAMEINKTMACLVHDAPGKGNSIFDVMIKMP